jgi:hypothetical protein
VLLALAACNEEDDAEADDDEAGMSATENGENGDETEDDD